MGKELLLPSEDQWKEVLTKYETKFGNGPPEFKEGLLGGEPVYIMNTRQLRYPSGILTKKILEWNGKEWEASEAESVTWYPDKINEKDKGILSDYYNRLQHLVKG